MQFQEAIKRVQQEDRLPLYVIVSEEYFFQEKLLTQLRQRWVTPAISDFNFALFNAAEMSDQQLLQQLNEYPLMAEYRVVICRNLEQLTVTQAERLLAYIQQPLASTTLIVTMNKIDKRIGWQKALAAAPFFFAAEKLYDDQIIKIFRQMAAGEGLQMSSESAELLFAHTGADLAAAFAKLEQIKLLLPQGESGVTDDLINQVGAYSGLGTPFQLINDTLSGKPGKALAQGKRMLEQGVELFALLGGMYFQVHKLWQIKAAFGKQNNDQQAFALLEMPRRFFERDKNLAKRFSDRQYAAFVKSLERVDRDVKSTSLTEISLFQRLIFEFVAEMH
jgi:DNA polymerase III delta subunit